MTDDNVVQMALFGPAVPARELSLPPFDDEPSPEVQDTLNFLARFDSQVETLLDAFPDHERKQAARHLYLDGDGNARTRHGALRSVT